MNKTSRLHGSDQAHWFRASLVALVYASFLIGPSSARAEHTSSHEPAQDAHHAKTHFAEPSASHPGAMSHDQGAHDGDAHEAGEAPEKVKIELDPRKKSPVLAVPMEILKKEATSSSPSSDAAHAQKKPQNCGVLLDFTGKLEILDANRTQVLPSDYDSPFVCGSWFSSNNGFAKIKHIHGQIIHLGPETLVQINQTGEQILLYRGSLYLDATSAPSEFRLMTATARARVEQGKILLLFNSEQDITQLVVLDQTATLENRFEMSRRVEAQAGEFTELNLTQKRVIPNLPSLISQASLKAMMEQLKVPEKDQLMSQRVVTARQDMKFAVLTQDTKGAKNLEIPQAESGGIDILDSKGRSLASERAEQVAAENKKKLTLRYRRSMPDPEDPELEKIFVKKMVGGEESAMRLVAPQYKKIFSAPSAEEEVKEAPTVVPLSTRDRAEKDKLIRGLSEIRME